MSVGLKKGFPVTKLESKARPSQNKAVSKNLDLDIMFELIIIIFTYIIVPNYTLLVQLLWFDVLLYQFSILIHFFPIPHIFYYFPLAPF